MGCGASAPQPQGNPEVGPGHHAVGVRAHGEAGAEKREQKDDATQEEERERVRLRLANSVTHALAPAAADPRFPREGVSVRWLREFVKECRGKTYSFTAREFLTKEHGGGGTLQVDAAELNAHRERCAQAMRDFDGIPTSVHYANIPFVKLTTANICDAVVKPATEALQCSYTATLLEERDAVRPATVFVSHGWHYTFVEAAEALCNLPNDAYVWFDVFTVNRHIFFQGMSPDFWYTTLKDFIASVGHTVVVLMPWNDPLPLTRAWCVLEILYSVDGKAKLEILLPPSEETAFRDFLVDHGSSKVVDEMLNIDVGRAEAFKKEDLDDILNAVRAYPGGISEVNKIIKDLIRIWILKAAKAALDGLSCESRATSKLLTDVANVFRIQGKYAEAEVLYREALEGRRRELGDAHPDTLLSKSYLASMFQVRGRFDEAEVLYLEALEGQRSELGDIHPHTLRSIYDLANIFRNQGRYAEAEVLYREAMEGHLRELGKTHRGTLWSINGLAELLEHQSKYAEAEVLYREALEGFRCELGNAHPDTLRSINGLAELLEHQSKYAEAEVLYREALEGFRCELGNAHPDTLRSINGLANLLMDQAKHAEAESLYREALKGFRRELGDEHPDTLETMNALARLLKSQGSNADAEPLYRKIFEIREALNGSADFETMKSMNDLANVLADGNGAEESKLLYAKLLEIQRREYGNEHPFTRITKLSLGTEEHAISLVGDVQEPPIFQGDSGTSKDYLGVRLDVLIRNAKEWRGKKYSFKATNVFLKRERIGEGPLVVDEQKLPEHRRNLFAAAREGQGDLVTVEYRGIPFEDMSTENVCCAMIKPLTEEHKCSYAELIQQTDPDAIGPASVFISHAWLYTFADVLETLESLQSEDGGHAAHSKFVWFDIFVCNQHQSGKQSDDSSNRWAVEFKHAVSRIGHTVVVLHPWDDPLPLARAWCVWEIFSTIDGGIATLDLRFPPPERRKLCECLVEEGADTVVEKLLHIDIKNAKAKFDKDREMILGAVQRFPGGESEINRLVKDQMRQWLIDSATEELKSHRSSRLMVRVADLLRHQGRYAEALGLYSDAVDLEGSDFWDRVHRRYIATVSLIHDVAKALEKHAQYDEAAEYAQFEVEGLRYAKGAANPQTLEAILNLASLLKKQGNLESAKAYCTEALNGYRKVFGDEHVHTQAASELINTLLT